MDHAGYARYIVERNPPRRDYEGNELGDSEGDEEADALAADENPYSGIKLEGRVYNLVGCYQSLTNVVV